MADRQARLDRVTLAREPPFRIKTLFGPGPFAQPGAVEFGDLCPCRAKPRRGCRQFRPAGGLKLFRGGLPPLILGTADRAEKPNPGRRRAVSRTDGEARPRLPDQHPPVKGILIRRIAESSRKPIRSIFPALKGAELRGAGEFVTELEHRIRCASIDHPFGLGAALGAPMRRAHQLSPRRIFRVGEAEAQVDQIPKRNPEPPRLAGRIGVPGSRAAIGPHDPLRHSEVDLEPPGMRVRPDQQVRARSFGDPREQGLAQQVEDLRDLAPGLAIAPIERLERQV